MIVQEFSDTFDTLVNSYGAMVNFGHQDIAFDEYEKSQFLTIAQEELVSSLYSGRNPQGDSFESTEEIRRYLSNLIEEKVLKPIANYKGIPLGMSSSSKFFTLPENVWFITYEEVIINKGKCKCRDFMKVYPTKQDEYQSIKNNPFRGANDRRALRLDLSEGNVEIICKYHVTDYYIRYIKKLTPIVLVDLPDNISINGVTKVTDCILHESLHQRILDLAVRLALKSKGFNVNNETKSN